MNQQEQYKKMSQLCAKCWADEDFKKRFLADPAFVLQEEGVELPSSMSIKVVENTDKVFYLVIPAKPTDLLDEDLDTPDVWTDCQNCHQPHPKCSMLCGACWK